MTSDAFDLAFQNFDLEAEYADFIMAHGDRPIGNGGALIRAMEGLYLYEEFRASMVA